MVFGYFKCWERSERIRESLICDGDGGGFSGYLRLGLGSGKVEILEEFAGVRGRLILHRRLESHWTVDFYWPRMAIRVR